MDYIIVVMTCWFCFMVWREIEVFTDVLEFLNQFEPIASYMRGDWLNVP